MIFELDKFYEIRKNGKLEIAQFTRMEFSNMIFNYIDGEQEELVLNEYILEAGLYNVTPYVVLNTLLS